MSIVVVIVIVGTKIARSRDLGVYACWKHNESVDIYEKLVSVRFELLNMAHKRYKSCILRSACLWFTDRTHSDLLHVVSAHVHKYNTDKWVMVVCR